jgi:hypothetical protein
LMKKTETKNSCATVPLSILTLGANISRARILKHLLEVEKSTFREELSFQRSKSTTGLKCIFL